MAWGFKQGGVIKSANPIIRKLTLAAAMVVVFSCIVMSAQVSLAATQTLKAALLKNPPANFKDGLTPAEKAALDKDGLMPAEKTLLEAAQKGIPADFRTVKNEGLENIDPKDDPANAKNWGPVRTIRAELIRWLCTDKIAAGLVEARGILIVGAKISGPLDLECVDVPRRLILFGCALRKVNLLDASARTLAFNGSVIGGFYADRLETKGSLFMQNVKTAGEVSLIGANIDGNLECDGAEFNNHGGKALNADGLTVKGYVFLKNVKAKGAVRLLNAEVGANLECDGAEFNNPGNSALFADEIKVKGGINLRNGFRAAGAVRLLSADIGGNLECINAEFDNPDGYALNCENASIKGALFLSQLKGLVGVLDLMHAQAGVLVDDKTGWPEKRRLHIVGFEYGDLTGDQTLSSASERLKWLSLQPTTPFSPRPYEQLAKVFRDMGRESDAREVLIAMHEGLRSELGPLGWLWNLFLEVTIGYGYETWWASLYLIAFLLFGWRFFGWAYNHGIMHCSKECRGKTLTQCSKECRGQTFSPFMYSLDVLLPVINFHQKDYFIPDPTTPRGIWVRRYFWLHIALGWIFATLVVASLTGLVHK
jgi:hypothetical protein